MSSAGPSGSVGRWGPGGGGGTEAPCHRLGICEGSEGVGSGSGSDAEPHGLCVCAGAGVCIEISADIFELKHLAACFLAAVPLSAATWPYKDRAVLWDRWMTALPQHSYSSLIFFFYREQTSNEVMKRACVTAKSHPFAVLLR